MSTPSAGQVIPLTPEQAAAFARGDIVWLQDGFLVRVPDKMNWAKLTTQLARAATPDHCHGAAMECFNACPAWDPRSAIPRTLDAVARVANDALRAREGDPTMTMGMSPSYVKPGNAAERLRFQDPSPASTPDAGLRVRLEELVKTAIQCHERVDAILTSLRGPVPPTVNTGSAEKRPGPVSAWETVEDLTPLLRGLRDRLEALAADL